MLQAWLRKNAINYRAEHDCGSLGIICPMRHSNLPASRYLMSSLHTSVFLSGLNLIYSYSENQIVLYLNSICANLCQ